MSYTCQVDFYYETKLDEFFSILENYDNPKITSYIHEGPGGGNPCINLTFEDRNKCIEFLKHHYQNQESDEFIYEQIF
jgi:hypothetical protein